MTEEVTARVRRSARYRDVDRALLTRLAEEELPRSRNADDAAKRVKRRLHQAVGAFRGARDARLLTGLHAAWNGSLHDPAFRDACRAALATHASTCERLPVIEELYTRAWERTGGPPRRLADLGCGLNPLALPWMGLRPDAFYLAVDADRRPLELADAFLTLVGQPHQARATDLVTDPPRDSIDVALLLKLVTTLDRQDPNAAARLLRTVDARHAVVSFPGASLGGRGKGMERTYRARLEQLADQLGPRLSGVAEASVPGELAFVLTLT
ncbi:MAG TPA: 16S rRNA methyltransferase [candidate division Zixibacteria bacterium]|nr:16S rRNA methyltransferase [candidate division Zixibacteria bacterium]